MAMSSQPPSSQSGQLTSDDLQEVFQALHSFSPGNVVNMGLELKVSRNVIQSFELKCADIYYVLREILHARLNQLPPLTWHDIVRALQSPTVQQHDLATKIESQFVTVSQSPASVSLQASQHEVHSDPPQTKRPRHDTSVAQLSEHLTPQGSVTSQHDALYPPDFTSYVKDVYRGSIAGDCKDTKWPPTASEVFIQLAILDRETVSVEEADVYTEAMVNDGNVDAILRKKTRRIQMNDVAKDVPKDRIILVEGAPGVGKSTFA